LHGRGRGRLEHTVALLRAEGHDVTVVPTLGPQTATAIAHEYATRGVDLVLVAGGDGTINEVTEGLVHTDIPMGILPSGTANVLATELKLSTDMEIAARRLSECRPHRVSVGHLSLYDGAVSRHFLLMAGIGLDAHIVYRVSAPLKQATGKLAYWLAGWALLGRPLAEFQVEIGGVRRTCSFALISKVRNYGGDLEIAREVSLFDDRFEVILFEGKSTVPYVRYFIGVMRNRLDGMKGVTVLRERCLQILPTEDPRVYVQVDGELVGFLPAQIRIVPDALTVLVPPEYAATHR
jgi:diacylglycerol kinase family enzyme